MFMSSITIAVVGGLIVALPYILWEVWKFVKPALKPEELKYMRGVIFWVSFFFFCGAAFGYFLLAPFTFNFLANYKIGTLGTIQYKPMLSDYLDSLIDITLGAGLAFELPMASWVLSKMGLVTPSFLRNYRKYAYVALLVVAAVITPSPDWGSQLIVVIPLVLLYELSILISARVSKDRAKADAEWQ
jgi:sec-independent protein translocase protein TatC